MQIIEIAEDNFNEWLDLTLRLWPDSPMEEMQVTLQSILQSDRETGFLIQDDNGTTMGFINLSLRFEFVPGATQTPTAYIEGIYVKDEYRDQGVGRYLIQYAEQWAFEHGCVELGSDALIENIGSYEFHTKLGFQEVERVVTFIKKI